MNGSAQAYVRKQQLLATVFSITTTTFLCLFGLQAFLNNNLPLATICGAGSIITIANIIFLKKSGNHQIACLVTVALMISLTLYLVSSGGAHNTGPLWCFVLPILIFYALELKLGLIVLIIYQLSLVILLLTPGTPFLFTTYDSHFIYRFLGSLISVSILAFAYEYSRQDWQKESNQLNIMLEKLSRTDDLTGLINRRDMNERMTEEVSRFKQNRHSFCLINCDIDHFKNINDQYGHDCGDVVLKAISEVLQENVKEQDKVCRWGGEEFLILLPETKLNKAFSTAERLRRLVEQKIVKYDNIIIQVTISLGVAEFDGTETLVHCIKTSDRRLYRSKGTGRNRVS